jgi:hypothetical protein
MQEIIYRTTWPANTGLSLSIDPLALFYKLGCEISVIHGHKHGHPYLQYNLKCSRGKGVQRNILFPWGGRSGKHPVSLPCKCCSVQSIKFISDYRRHRDVTTTQNKLHVILSLSLFFDCDDRFARGTNQLYCLRLDS